MHQQLKKVTLLTVLVLLIALAITNQTGFHAESNTTKNFTIESADVQVSISNTENGSVWAEKLREKPITVKTPPFEPLQYIHIHADNLTSSSVTIRIFNEWGRSDLIIYHYTGDDWQPLKTRLNGSYLEAVTESFSVFAVGAGGGINIYLLANNLTFLNNTAAIAGAAYYNNSTAAAGINIEINPSWGSFANTTTDAQGNFLRMLTGPAQPGNYTAWVNATSGRLNGTNSSTVQATNATLYRINASASIANTTTANPYANISFLFPADAVPYSSNISLSLNSTTSMAVKVNNITIYNETANSANLNLTGYLTRQNDINITTVDTVTLAYNINLSFHITKTATVVKPSYYSASLAVANSMSYNWNNSNITYHLPDGAYGVTVWENSTNLTVNSTIPVRGGLLRIENNGTGTIYNNSLRLFSVNYSLAQVNINVTTDRQEAEKGENVNITPYVYFNDSQIDANAWIRIYRDSALVYNSNVSSGSPFAFSTSTAGVYNITATASPNIDGVVRSGANHTNLHIKELLIYLIVDPTHSGKPVNVTGRAYYTNSTAGTGTVNLSMDGASWNTTSNTTGYFNYSLPGKTAGSYVLSANITTGNYTASTNATVNVLDNYFYVIKGNLPVSSGEKTLSPNATVWINQTNITRATLNIWGKTTENLTYNPSPIDYQLIGNSFGSYISGTFTIPVYPYDYLEILSAFLNTSAEYYNSADKDFSFNLTIDNRQINSSTIKAGVTAYSQLDSLRLIAPDYLPFSVLNPGNLQTIKVHKISSLSQQYYFTEGIYVSYIGHVGVPRDLYFKVNNNFTFARMGDIPNATVDITGFSATSNSLLISNDRTSVVGYNYSLQKRYFGYTTHTVSKQTSKYNINDTVVFIPEANLTSATVLIPLMDKAKDVIVSVNGTNVTDSATVGINMELPLSEINSTKVINVTYWAPILDINTSVNNTQFNRGDTLQISANITYLGGNVSDATAYANITKAGAPVGNLTLNYTYGGMYIANYTLLSNAALGVYNVTVRAYNATTAINNESTTFKVRGLNVSANAGGPYVVDTNATITGYVRDLDNNSNISGASVNIRIWNSTFSYNTTRTTNATAYNLSRLVDYAGDYNVTVNASDANILGSANTTTYVVRYNVSVAVSQASYNKNSTVPINVTVYDRALTPVSGATVNSTVRIGAASYYNNSTTDANGRYNFTHSNTATNGTYNITANVSKAGVLGNATGSFRVSNLTVTVYTQAEYQVGSTVVINGTVKDDDTGVYPSGALVNVTINNGSAETKKNTTTSSGNYTVSFLYVYAGVYTANLDVTYSTLIGGNTTSFHMHYNVNTSISKTIYAISETVPVNVTVLDVNNTPASANVSINITKPDSNVENMNGTTVNGYFNTSFSNTSLDGDYNISVRALNASTSAHGDAVNRSFRATGFVVNASLDRSPRLYKPGEAVNISGVLRDTTEPPSPRIADVVIRINSSAGSEVANTTLYSRNGSYAWNTTLSNTSVAGWYTVTVNATTTEGAAGSTSAQFEVQLNQILNAQSQYNPGDAVNVTVLVRNGTTPESAIVNMAVQKFDIWDRFTGTYFDTGKMTATTPDCCTEALNYTQNDELIFYTTNVTQNDTWLGKAVQLNTTSLPSRFILDYEVSTNGSSAYLLSRPHIGNSTNYIRLNFRNYSDDAQDGYDFVINGATQSVKRESTNNMKVRLSIEYDSGTVRFYKNGEQMFQSNFILPSNSFIKLNGYARNPSNGSTAYIKYDNVTLYNLSSPVLNQSTTADGSGGNYTYNFTAGGIGMYRVNATTGNSSAYTTFLVRTLNVTTMVHGPYNFNESTLSSSTVVPLMVHGTVQDTETRANVTGAEVNISILQSGIPYAYNVTSSNAGNYVLSFTQSFNSTAVGLFNVSASVNDSSILATQNNSFTAYTINESWVDQYKDYRVPILLYNDGSLVGNWQFNEGVGTSIADSSGNGNTGTLYGASVSNPGFETVNSQWGSGAENLVFDNTRSKTGTYSGKIVKLTAGELVQFSSNNADNNAGTTLPSSSTQYRYGGCVYIEGGASADIFFFSWNSGGGNRYDGTYDAISTSVQNQWVCISGTSTKVVPADNLFAIRVDNNGGGTVWFDDVWVNAVEPWTSGKFGNAMTFDGVNDYVGLSSNIPLTGEFTVTAWINKKSTGSIQSVLGKDSDTSGSASKIIFLADNRIFARMVGGESNVAIDVGYTSSLDNSWNFLVVQRDENNNIKASLNGAALVTGSTALSGTFSPNLIGKNLDSQFFNGTIDDVKIYNRALSDSEIANMYNSSNIAQSYNPSVVTFNLALPGGFTFSSVKLYDIQGTDQGAPVDMGSYVNVTFAKTLSAYEGKILYLYFDRPNPTGSNNSAMSSLSAPYSVTNGTIEGYAITVTPDKNAYSAGETAVLSLQLQNVTGDYIVSDVTNTIYYPNGTIAQVNYTQTNATGQALVNYTIPSVKGSYTAITNATVNGISRKESTSFSTGDLVVYISKDKAVYNTLENVSIEVNVTENGNVTGAGVTLKIYDSNSIPVLEETKNTTTLWTQTSDADFNSGTLWNVTVGSGNVTLSKPGTYYNISGSLTSSMYDAGRITDWGALRWNETKPALTDITLYTRTSPDNSSWSDWLQGVNSTDIPNSSRYIQYRANLTTSDNTTTPTLSDVTIELAAPVNFTYTLSSSPLGNYTVTASASKSDNAGYNTTTFELDQFDISTAADRVVYTSSGSITVSGSTTYRGGNANASVNLTVKKNFAFNPSFETDLDNNGFPDGWIPAWQGVMTWDTAYRTGSKSVKVTLYPANTTEGLWYYPQMYVISPNTYYTFSMWAKTNNNTGGNVRLWVNWYNGTTYVSNAINTIRSIRLQDGWVLLQGSATSPSNANNVRVHLVSNIVGSVWFDDVNIEPENNPAVYTANTTSETLYSFTFSLSNSSSYIVYANGSYVANGILNRSNTTVFTVRSLDVNASAGGPFEPGAGNITIGGYAVDNRTSMAAPSAAVYINITYPNNTMQNYTNTTNTQGYYNYTIATPWLGGTYLVNITAIDYQNVAGTANTTFRIRANLSVQTNKTQYNPNETAQITVYVSNNSAGISDATVNITVRNQSGTRTNFSTLWGNVTDKVNGNYTANYSGTQALGNYTINATATKGSDDGAGNASFMVRRLNVTIQSLQVKVGESKSIYARVQDGTTNATIANAAVNITITNATSVVNLTNTTSGSSGYNIVTGAYTDVAGRYNVTINVTDQNNITGTAILPYIVNLSVNLTLSQTAYDPNETITATITVRENITSMAGGASVVASLTDYNGTVISSNTTTTNATGTALVNFTAPGNFSSYYVNVTAVKNSINGTASRLFTTSLLRIWTDKGEALIGDTVWASSGANSAPEEYRNLTIKVAALDSAGLRRTGQSLTAKVYKPDGTLYGSYTLNESDKIYSTSILFPGKGIPEGNYSIQIAEYPGIEGNFGVMIWGCARCHKDNGITYGTGHSGSGAPPHDSEVTMAPLTFDINHNHQSLANSCDYHDNGGDSDCTACHRNTVEGYPGSDAAPQKCTTCHYSPTTNQGNLNDTYGADLHANINNIANGSWYGKATACQSCHGNYSDPPTIPKCTNCHPASTGSGMQYMPESLSGTNRTLEDFENVADVLATTDRSGTTVSIATNDTTSINGTYSGRVSYTFGSGYGRAYIDKKNLDLTNATKISLWVYGDNSNTNISIGVNNTKSTKITWHMSAMTMINWSGWRKISVNINELSQSSLMYISAADTVRIRLEKYGGCTNCAILIDDLKAEKVGSHTQFDDIECGLCHGSKHGLALSPECNACHQSVGHGWPADDQYPGTDANCMNCHQTGMTENRINISNISQHTDPLEDFENISLFTTNLTNFNRSEIYYSGELSDNGNHSAVLNYTSLTGYRGNSINASNASKYKGISVFVNASNDPNTTLLLGVYTNTWYNYTRAMDWNGWRQVNVIYHNSTVNETTSFNATGTPSRIWLGVYGNNSTGSIYFDSLRQALSDDYHQYVSWKCADCHIQTKNLPGITDITSPIVNCLLCHDSSEPHYKQFTRVCMDCHFDSGHGDVDPSFTDYEKASTCLKCHTQPHNFTQTHLEASHCNVCHDQRIHGKNPLNVAYNESLHLDCERCHGKTKAESPLPLTLGNAGSIFLRLSYTYNNATQCIFCHENKINAYKLHTNLTVNESNLTLVAGILNDTVCTDCHDTKSITNDTDRDELTASDTMREPYTPQIAGHGNVTCYECHGHRPETLTLTVGSNCVGCHQDTSKLVQLIPGMLNDSSLSYVTNPGSQQLIVRSPQVTGHGNTSCSACHGHTNSNLTYISSDDASCAGCHHNTSSNVSLIELRLPNSTSSTVINPGGNPLYVIPPQVLGHGNTSCHVCHEHNPYTYKGTTSLVGGTECELCHQNASTNVTLVVNTTPASNKTEVVDNSTSVWIVHAPQVAGHGHTACSECHSHNAESLTYNGRTDADCVLCHYNASAKTSLLQNGSYVQPPQIVPHNDLNCTECHSHTPVSMTRISDCSVCHQNATKAQSLIDTYTIGLNITLPAGNISAMQIPNLSHSTGIKWNKTTAYWTNDTYACQYCHKISRNYSSHDALGRVSAIQGNNVKNSGLVGSYWCASCHYQNYSSGNVTYNDTVRIYTEAGLPVPAEITANISYGNYTFANDNYTKYYRHVLSNYSDAKCVNCHGEADNTKDFLHAIAGGYPSCISCHDTGKENSDYRMNNSEMNLGVHANLNSNATNSTGVQADNKKCWGCHTSTGKEPTVDMGDKYYTPYRCMECHNSTVPYVNVSSAPNVSEHFRSGKNITALGSMVNDTWSCLACHNLTDMKVNYTEDDAFRSNISIVSHYAKNYTSLSSLRNSTNSTQYCIYCHDNDSSIFNVFLTKKTHHGFNCSVCHGTGKIHDDNLSDGYTPALPSTPGGNISGCLWCHADANSSISENYLLNMTMFNDSAHYLRPGFNCLNCHISNQSQHPSKEYNWKWCESCHSYQSDPLNSSDRHNITLDPFNYTLNVNGTMTSVVNITDCTFCHNATAYNNAVANYTTNKCRYCHVYPDKGNKTSQSWY